MRFSFLVVIVALTASMVSASGSKTLGQTKVCYNPGKSAGRFARGDTLRGNVGARAVRMFDTTAAYTAELGHRNADAYIVMCSSILSPQFVPLRLRALSSPPRLTQINSQEQPRHWRATNYVESNDDPKKASIYPSSEEKPLRR
ncbi:hypothetical protein EDB19DRAFT_1834925 [Suillus lakei]|nr:hypothetical protein EDB19DRAFT_1837196 [Suillus lakei]KAG1722605.1 hypothetical protein EDB19DRAFT_1834925 [Suillus lakei]